MYDSACILTTSLNVRIVFVQVLHELHSKASYSDPLPSTAVVTQMAPPAPVCLPKQMGPKSRQLISLNIADMITALEVRA